MTGLFVYDAHGMFSITPVSTTVNQSRLISVQAIHMRLHFADRQSKRPCQRPTFNQLHGQQRLGLGPDRIALRLKNKLTDESQIYLIFIMSHI